MNKLYILIITLLFTSYAGACFHSKTEKYTTSFYELAQSSPSTFDATRCVWPPCDDDW